MQNKELTLAASATRDGTDVFEPSESLTAWRGATVIVDATASNGDGTQDLDIAIRIKDPVSGNTIDLITDTLTDGATATRAYLIYPGVSDTQGAYQAIEEVPLPTHWEVQGAVSQGGAGTVDYTYSVGVVLHK